LRMIGLLLDHLTPALCEAVFEQQRTTQRTRKWTFHAVTLFWAAMIVRHPPSLQHGLDQTRRGRGRDQLWPRVMAAPQAFFQKAQGLRPSLFKATYEAFTRSILPKARPLYASWLGRLRERFPDVLIVDGSRLDAVCHRLKLLRSERAQVLPGCLIVFYDLFRGITRQVLFSPHAAAPELPRARAALAWIARGTLLVGDRLYASVQFFHQLAAHQLAGLVRRHGQLTVRRLRRLSRQAGDHGVLDDTLVEVGSGQTAAPLRLRLIRYRGSRHRLDVLTNVLDPLQLTPAEAMALYRLRWSVERLFLDLKETLDLHCLYASHPNLVAQQVYAAAIVHTAFRVAQAGIAHQAKVLPEQLSPAKLFPKLAQAANDHCVAHITVLKTRALNPGLAITFPGWHTLPSAYTTLGKIIVHHRTGLRRHRKFCAARKRWKSFMHVTGGPTFLRQSVLDG
ncbi:MAG: IS4 family transposase, partial [Candidatus Omnitrophica bacterium]|nr:IS4 family transposase [Candidatus Omnitrophota bacterium]